MGREWSYHMYEGSDPKRRGTYVRCRSNPCGRHGSGDIIAGDAEEAYAKAHDGELQGMTSASPDFPHATSRQMEDYRRTCDTSTGQSAYPGSRQWAEGMIEVGFLDDDPDDTRLVESYDDFLAGFNDPAEIRPMRYMTVCVHDDANAQMTENDMSRKEAEMLAMYALRGNDESPIHGLPDDRFARLVFDDAERGKAVEDAEAAGLLSFGEYSDYRMEDKARNALDDDD